MMPPDGGAVALAWVPAAVREMASDLRRELSRQGMSAELALLQRLATDPRMQRVWRELQRCKRDRQHRPTASFCHAARPSGPDVAWSLRARALRRRAAALEGTNGGPNVAAATRLRFDAAGVAVVQAATHPVMRSEFPLQERAMAALFAEAFRLAAERIQVTTRRPLPEARRAQRMAARLRADAARHDESRLLEAARVYDEIAYAATPSPDDPLIVGRCRGDPHLRGYVRALADTTRAVFGDRLYGVVATIANVALARTELTAQQVRKLCH